MTQLTLFDRPPEPEPEPAPEPCTIQQRFLAFHQANPHVFLRFLAAARALVRSGRTRFGAKQIYERMRYEQSFATQGDPFKLNNSYTSRYARLLLEEFPGEFDDFVELRRLRSE